MNEKKTTVKKALCYFCHARCGAMITVEDGKAVRIEGNKDGLSRGFLCPKGRAAIEHLYHPERLNYVHKRVGERGENKWQQIPYDQALDEIAEYLRKMKQEYGAEAMVTSHGTFRTNREWIEFAWLHLFGCPNFLNDGIICYCNTQSIGYASQGWFSLFAGSCIPGETKCIIQWGHNPAMSYPMEMANTLRAQSKGAKLIVVDPRLSDTASRADLWLQIRPATDAALGLGMINVIINEQLYNKGFVDQWTVGFDQLKERVQEYPPEKVAEITRIPKEKIIEAARIYATNTPGIIAWGVALDQIGRNSTQTLRCQNILRGLAGNLDVRGGEYMGFTGDMRSVIQKGDLECTEYLSPEQRRKQLGAGRFKLQAFPGWELMAGPYERVWGHKFPAYPLTHANPMYVWDAILHEKPYPVKALFCIANNALLSRANTKRVYKALKALDLLVVVDYWMTPTALLADYVMPAADWMERYDLDDMCGGAIGSVLLPSDRCVEPLFDRHTDYEFWQGLALRLGLDDKAFPWKMSFEEICNYRLKPIGITFRDVLDKGYILFPREYKKYEKAGFATPSGKVELYSSVMETLGYDPLPHYEEPAESHIRTPEVAKEYPLILTTSPRILEFYHSEQRQIRSLRSRHPDPLVQIHPTVGEKEGIEEGDWIYIETQRGRIRMRAQLNPTLMEDVVVTEHSWWFPEEPAEEPFLHGLWISNPNVLTVDDLDDCDQACGGWTNRGLLCKVYKVEKY